MKPGDLVKIDMPGDPHRGQVGLVIGRERRIDGRTGRGNPSRFIYEVMVSGDTECYFYEELLEESEWGADEAR